VNFFFLSTYSSQQAEIARIEQQKQLYEKQEKDLEEIIKKKQAIDAQFHCVRNLHRIIISERQNSEFLLEQLKFALGNA
jgi:hypothetical protein